MVTQAEIQAFEQLCEKTFGKSTVIHYRRSGPGKGFRLKSVAGFAIGRGLFIGRSLKAALAKLAILKDVFS